MATKETKKVTGAHTGASTVATQAKNIVQLSEVQKKIAARMGMTEKDYSEYADKIAKGDRTVK